MTSRFIPTDVSFSLEVFPPKTPAGLAHLMETVAAYDALAPAAITVTFGATGTLDQMDQVQQVIREIHAQSTVPVAAHMTCANKSRAQVDAMIDALVADGVRHIVALRGDMMGDSATYKPAADGYPMTYDYIASIKARHPSVHIYVAGYPETHPESPSESFDLDHLKHKVDAGADAVLTQFFFDPEIFFRWRDKVEKRGITVPLIPGLLPVINFPKMCVMARRCNASVPSFMATMFEGVEPESLDHKLLAMNILSHQITRLVEHGVSHFHFYTMNETLLTRHLCRWMRAGF